MVSSPSGSQVPLLQGLRLPGGGDHGFRQVDDVDNDVEIQAIIVVAGDHITQSVDDNMMTIKRIEVTIMITGNLTTRNV